METNIIQKHEGCKNLLSYQRSLIVYEITVVFCNRFLNHRDPTVDQMIQAARSDLEELLEDYQDYLRTHRSRIWADDSPEAVHMRKIGRGLPKSKSSILELVRTRKAPVICNMAICLIHQTNYLLDQQLHQVKGTPHSLRNLRERIYQAPGLTR